MKLHRTLCGIPFVPLRGEKAVVFLHCPDGWWTSLWYIEDVPDADRLRPLSGRELLNTLQEMGAVRLARLPKRLTGSARVEVLHVRLGTEGAVGVAVFVRFGWRKRLPAFATFDLEEALRG